MPRRLQIIVLLWLVAAPNLTAQDPPCTRRTVLVNVLTKDGDPVPEVEVGQFRAAFRGKPVRIISTRREFAPRRIVILLDVSGSMLMTKSKWQLARKVVGDMLTGGQEGNQIAFLTFGFRVYHKIGFDEDRQLMADHLATLSTEDTNKRRKMAGKALGGTTALWDAVWEGLSSFGMPQPGDVIYVITDGGNTSSSHRRSEVEKALLAAGVRLFAFLLYSPLSIVSDADLPASLVETVQATGGSYAIFHSSPPEIPTEGDAYDLSKQNLAATALVARRLTLEMMTAYYLEIELPQPIDKVRQWKLEVVPLAGAKKSEWTVAYQRKLLPCAVTSPASPK